MNTFIVFAIVLVFVALLLTALFLLVAFLSAYGLLPTEDYKEYIDDELDKL